MTIDNAWLADRADDFKASFLFLTRLPFGWDTPTAAADIGRGAWAFPIAGIVVGLIGAVVYALVHRLGVTPWPAAALAVAATLLATGCLHEDGLADTADGFGGGKTREQKLDIMRDSRIGTYGVCALAISLLLRVGALASLADTHAVLWALIASHGAARAAMPALMYLLPTARSDGLSHGAGQPPVESVIAAAIVGFLLLAIGLHPAHALFALIFLGIAGGVMGWLSLRQIGGQTGDVLGASEQIGEIVILLAALG